MGLVFGQASVVVDLILLAFYPISRVRAEEAQRVQAQRRKCHVQDPGEKKEI